MPVGRSPENRCKHVLGLSENLNGNPAVRHYTCLVEIAVDFVLVY